jgi:predicted amidohydrolase YtcJ
MNTTSSNNSVAYYNGRIYTINSSQPWAEAFIVSSDGVFTAIGSSVDILQVAEREKMITRDLRGVFVMPGIHDGHMHLLFAGLALLSDATLGMDVTTENVAQKTKYGCCACQYSHTYEDWILANTFAIDSFDREALDMEYPDTPVVIRAGAGHNMYLNTAALKRAGYRLEDEPDTQATRFVRRDDGSLTGELSELAMNKAALAIPQPAFSHVKRCLKHAISLAHKAGVTSLQEAASNTLMLHALRELDSENALKMDIAAHIVYAPEYIGMEPQDSLKRLLDNANEYKTKHLDTRFLKVILDGVPLPPLFTHAGLTADGEVDVTKLTIEDIARVVREYDQRGFTCKIHCTGEGSTRVALDAIEMTRKSNPSGPRHEIAHCSGVHAGTSCSSSSQGSC